MGQYPRERIWDNNTTSINSLINELIKRFQDSLSHFRYEPYLSTNLPYLTQLIKLKTENRNKDLEDVLYDFTKNNKKPSLLHDSLVNIAQLIQKLHQTKETEARIIIIETCFSSTLEEAFKNACQYFHLLFFVAKDLTKNITESQFYYQFYNSSKLSEAAQLTSSPDLYDSLLLNDNYPIIVKIYGHISDFTYNKNKDSIVITEDNFINLLGTKEINNFLPNNLISILVESSFLFIDYSIRDWSLRIFLNHIWDKVVNTKNINNNFSPRYYAFQPSYNQGDELFWENYNVALLQTTTLEQLLNAIVQKLGSS